MTLSSLRQHAHGVKRAHPDSLVFVDGGDGRFYAFDDLSTIGQLTSAPAIQGAYCAVYAAALESYVHVLRRAGYDVLVVEQLTLPTVAPVAKPAQLLMF